jgi:hypothetical protein
MQTIDDTNEKKGLKKDKKITKTPQDMKDKNNNLNTSIVSLQQTLDDTHEKKIKKEKKHHNNNNSSTKSNNDNNKSNNNRDGKLSPENTL